MSAISADEDGVGGSVNGAMEPAGAANPGRTGGPSGTADSSEEGQRQTGAKTRVTLDLELDSALLTTLQGSAERRNTSLGEAVSRRHLDLHRYTIFDVLRAQARAFGLTEDEAMAMAVDELAELRAERAAAAEGGTAEGSGAARG